MGETSPEMMTSYKLLVEVVGASGLMTTDAQGSTSACVELKIDGQRFRTAVKEKDLNPVWNERFYFDVTDPSYLRELVLDAYVLNVQKTDEGSSLSDLGMVKITGASVMPFVDATPMHYVLKKRRLMSQVKGSLTLKLKLYIADSSAQASNPVDLESLNNLESILKDHSSRPYSIPLRHLKDLTNNFSHDRIVGQGGFGVVYKGILPNGETIAVKKIMSSLTPGLQKQFENDVYHLMMLKHPNIVRCLGYCYEIRNECVKYNGEYVFAEMAEKLLCLEYLPMGSLDKHISDESCGHNWSRRYKTIMGISYGLCHLHEQIDKPIIHLDLKPANILLDDMLVPKITDFGLSRILDQPHTVYTDSRVGTFGYMAPEFLHGGIITPKSDIFSLGVIIMEIITGYRDYPGVSGTSSNGFIELALEKWRTVLQRSPGYNSLEMDCGQIKRCIQVGLICVNPDRTKRPPITKIINMLQGSESIDCDISKEGV